MRTMKTSTITILAVGLLAGSTVGVAATNGEAETELLDGFGEKVSTSFTGRFTSQLDVITEGTQTLIDDLRYTDGVVVRMSMVSSDPRLTGPVTFTGNWIADVARVDGMGTMMVAGTYELTNDGGRWLGEYRSLGDLEHQVHTGLVTFVGHDGYEGLIAVALMDTWDWAQTYQGTIFPAAMPEMPEPYVE